MKYCFRLLTIVTILATPLLEYSQTSPAPWITDAERAKFEELRVSGSLALFNLDYTGARKSFKEMITAFPNYPAGPQFLADTLWTETLYNMRKLQSSLYGSDSFYAATEDKADPAVVNEFRALTRQARLLTEARLKEYPKDPEALYFLGAIEGLKASFEEAVERRHVAALKDGSDAVEKHRQVIKLDPNYRDAELSIGLYDYTVGALPLPYKITAGLFGFRGSKKRGLTTLERVAKEGKWVHDEAKTLLIVLYKREKRYAEAAALARELAAKYPRNYICRMEIADALVLQAEQEREANHTTGVTAAETEAFAIFESLLKDKAVRDTASRAFDLIHYKYGEALMNTTQYERAAKEFLAATVAPGAQQGLATMAHLNAAQALDLAGKRNDALAQYRVVLGRPNVYDAHDQAQIGLKEVYKRKLS